MEGTDSEFTPPAEEEEIVYRCPECEKVLQSPQGLGSHRRRMHGVKGEAGGRYKHHTLYLTEGDERILEYIMDALVISSQAEAIRRSITAYASHLQTVLGVRP